jgi:signal transduction histidine kinase/HAMP domain-containing protein
MGQRMSILISTFTTSPYVSLPQGFLGWSGWLLLLSLDVYLLYRWKSYNKFWGKTQKYIFILLILSIPVCGLLLAIQNRPEPAHSFPPPGSEITILLLSAIPWMLAGGLLGTTPAAVIGLLTGISLSLWHSHNIFTPLEIGLFAILYSTALMQNYRSPIFRFLRHPFIAATGIVLITPWIHFLVMSFATSGSALERLNYAISSLINGTIIYSIPILLGGLVCGIIAHIQPGKWGSEKPLVPSPYERSLKSRLSLYMLPLVLILTLALIAGTWLTANRTSRNMVKSRMFNAAKICEENLSHFFDTGVAILTNLVADERLLLADPSEIELLLETKGGDSNFYSELLVVDSSGNIISAYKEIPDASQSGPVMEIEAVRDALNDASIKVTASPPKYDIPSATVSIIVPIFDTNQNIERLLIGRTNFDTNPLAQPLLTGLSQLSDLDGDGMLLNQESRVLVHPQSQMIYTKFNPLSSNGFGIQADYSLEEPGKLQNFLVYQKYLDNLPWSLVFTVPVLNIQKSAISSSIPLLGLITAVALLTILILIIAVRTISNSLSDLALGAGQISDGRIDYPLHAKGSDEFAQLGRSFEKMRNNLQAQLYEQNKLLQISQTAASTLYFPEVVEPILESALSTGADSARVVLNPAVLPEFEGVSSEPIRFHSGDSMEILSALDSQILHFFGGQDQLERLVLPDIKRPKLFELQGDLTIPASLLAVALRSEGIYFGVLWVAFNEYHEFTQDEVRLLTNIGTQTNHAAANASMYAESEISRQRIEAVLNSIPDPLLVFDNDEKLIIANSNAEKLLHLATNPEEKPRLEEIIKNKELKELLSSNSGKPQSLEIELDDGEVYLAITNRVTIQEKNIGKLCLLRNITALKDLDTLKTEFVWTVSHDLRSPLTLMRGYATMLEIVGELNEQQMSYVQKIVEGVESMTHLVNNLLDLGRLESGIVLHLELISAKEMIEHVVSGLNLQAVQKRINMTVEIDENLPEVEADKALLQQALHNLVENAIKFSRTEGKVTISAKATHKSMKFRIHDNGIGISPMDQLQLFEKFHRVSQKSGEEQRGSGLGLAIVRSIAERHKGNATVNSQLGKGSTFYFELPLRQPNNEK